MADFTYSWTNYGYKEPKKYEEYIPQYKQMNIAKPTSTYKPTEYSDSSGTYARDIAQAKAALNKTNSSKPGAYVSQYADRMNSIVDQLGSRKFSYDVNSDALFQQLKSLYNEQGRLAMADTQGQAAALTGGYGNSYATSASQQAYQQNQENLYNRIPELQQMALTQYQQEGSDLQNLYAMLSDRDTSEYGRYRDTVSDWQNDRSYYDTALRNLQSMNQSVWSQNETNRYNANAQAWNNYFNGANYDLDAETAARNLALQLLQNDQNEKWNAINATETSKQNSWDRAFSEAQAQDDNAYKYAALAEDARQFDVSATETNRHNKANEKNDAYSNQTTREHYERSDANDTSTAESKARVTAAKKELLTKSQFATKTKNGGWNGYGSSQYKKYLLNKLDSMGKQGLLTDDERIELYNAYIGG